MTLDEVKDQVAQKNGYENWDDIWKTNFDYNDIEAGLLDEVAKQFAQAKLKEAASKIDEIHVPYKDDQLYSDGYNAATNDCLEAVVGMFKS